MIYASEDGDIYKDNGIRLGKVEYPAEVGQTSVITARFNLGKTELFPLENRCSIEGKKTKVIALVNNEQATQTTFCVNRSNITGVWNKEIDIPLGNDGDAGAFDIHLYFVQPDDGSNQFESSWRDMPESTITFTTEVVPEGEEPPPGAGDECTVVLGKDPCPDGYVCYEGVCTPENDVPDDGGDGPPDDGGGGGDPPDDDGGSSGGISGQTMLAGLLGAGLWARSRRDE